MPARLSILVAGLALLAATGCDAPLQPESRKQAPSPTASARASASASATPRAPAGSRPPAPAPTTPPRQPVPSITVPTDLGTGGVDRQVLGADASWPQCPKGMGIPQKRSKGSPMPLPTAEFVVLGLTNGPGFHPNPCLAGQVAWVRERGLMAAAYSIISWPDAATRKRYGSLREVGRAQAEFNLATMERAGLTTPVIWLDVEPVPDFEWSDDKRANAEVVQGAAEGYREAGYVIGAYSTAYLWDEVVGDLRLGVPEWRAAGQTSRREAMKRCGRGFSFQGGPSVLSQWVEAERDQDITCPGTSLLMTRWFHQY